jgi:uracil-DNA glycosylase family 4
MMALNYEKPPACAGCPLDKTGRGFVPASGPASALIALVGEAPGQSEATESKPFVGAAGVYLNRGLGLLGGNRETYRIGNVCQCQPPKDWLSGAPWEDEAIRHCHTHRYLNLYACQPTVYVTMGVTATKTVLKEVLHQDYLGKLEHWQGYVCGDQPPYVIPTFHPAHMLRGKQNLLGAFCFAQKRAMEVASFGFQRDEVSIVVDPDLDWFALWAAQLTPEAWLSVDIETPIKEENEEETTTETVGTITRINFSYHPDQGITVPWDPRYYPIIQTLLSSPNVKVFWNERYDVPILRKAGFPVAGLVMDGMWAWHILQSAVPKGLGFVAPNYSDLPPWKHLSADNPGYYAGMDALQTTRCMFGIARDLKQSGQWEVFLRHVVRFDANVLHPMEEVGLKLDPARLVALHETLEKRSAELMKEIQTRVPENQRPLVGNWKTPGNPGSFPKTVRKVVPCCTDCGEEDVTLKHQCREEHSKL